MERLNKYIASCGVCGRRQADELIAQGRIQVNGSVAVVGAKVQASDTVLIDGICVSKNPFVYVMLHKPPKCVTTVKDQFDRKTVMDYVDIKTRLFPIGRLDYHTTGLLLLTNDGEFANHVLSSKNGVEKTYSVKVREEINDKAIEKLRRGVKITENGVVILANAKIEPQRERSTIKITITEGHNRQVRQMCEQVGLTVISLKRVSIGGLTLGGLQIGEWRYLSEEDLKLVY